MNDTPMREPGPFKADQLGEDDRYELVNGHAYYVNPAGARHAASNVVGALPIATDPLVQTAAIDAGFSPTEADLHAPDIAVGDFAVEPGWIEGKVPALAVEYADGGQDEAALAAKIASLLHHGTRFIWVVRLKKSEVEIHEPGKPMTRAKKGELLHAPGVLENALRVEALFERDAALDATLKNLLQRRGYEGIEAVAGRAREEGREEGGREALRRALFVLFAARRFEVDEATRAIIEACAETGRLESWIARAATAESASAAVSAFNP